MVEPTQIPVRFGSAATRQGPYMSTCTVPCTRRAVTCRPRLQGGQGIGFLERSTPANPVYVPDVRDRDCHCACGLSVDSVSQATRCVLAETVWGAGSAKCCHRLVSRHGAALDHARRHRRTGRGVAREARAVAVRLAGISFCLLRHGVVDGQRERAVLRDGVWCGRDVLALTF